MLANCSRLVAVVCSLATALTMVLSELPTCEECGHRLPHHHAGCGEPLPADAPNAPSESRLRVDVASAPRAITLSR